MWYAKVTSDLSNIPDFIAYYEDQLVHAKQDISVKGNEIGRAHV